MMIIFFYHCLYVNIYMIDNRDSDIVKYDTMEYDTMNVMQYNINDINI